MQATGQLDPLSALAANAPTGNPLRVSRSSTWKAFFAGAARRTPFAGHTASGEIAAEPAAGMQNLAAVFHGTPVEDLCRAELWRYERNPLEAWDELLAHSNEDRVPNPKNIFRSKFHGFFYVAPAQDSFMLRMRVPGDVLAARQLRGLADMAEDWARGEPN